MSHQSESRPEPAINLPVVITAMLLLMAAIHFVRAALLSPDADTLVLIYGAFIPARYAAPLGSWDIEWFTTPASYSLLHGSWSHLINNSVWLAAFGSPVALLIGTRRFLLLWTATAVLAAVVHWATDPGSMAPLIGASGSVSGMMGAAARTGMRFRRGLAGGPLPSLREAVSNRSVVSFIGMYLLINIGVAIAGYIPSSGAASIAWQAHIGGLAAGFLLLPLFMRPGRQ